MGFAIEVRYFIKS